MNCRGVLLQGLTDISISHCPPDSDRTWGPASMMGVSSQPGFMFGSRRNISGCRRSSPDGQSWWLTHQGCKLDPSTQRPHNSAPRDHTTLSKLGTLRSREEPRPPSSSGEAPQNHSRHFAWSGNSKRAVTWACHQIGGSCSLHLSGKWGEQESFLESMKGPECPLRTCSQPWGTP